MTQILISNCDLIGVPSVELMRKANELEEDKAKISYLKLVIQERKSHWWSFSYVLRSCYIHF